jgi:hypothetical protein
MDPSRGEVPAHFTSDRLRIRAYVALAAIARMGASPAEAFQTLAQACGEPTGEEAESLALVAQRLAKATSGDGVAAGLHDAFRTAFGALSAEETAVLNALGSAANVHFAQALADIARLLALKDGARISVAI